MEALRDGIGLRGYGQKDPKQEYKKEGFTIFGEMIVTIGRNVCEKLYHMQVKREEPQPVRQRAPRKTIESGGGSSSGNGQGGAPAADESRPVRRTEPKVGRNDPCPCGSGKKYKKCHGAQVTT
jgi:preprotein translocase subunit SecA